MLRYVSKLDDNSSNFFLGAIDYDVILDDQYWKYLCEEMYRALDENGIIIDGGVGSIGYYINKYLKGKLKLIYESGSLAGSNIWEKLSK